MDKHFDIGSIDLNRPSLEIALDLIHISNHFDLDAQEVVLGNPVALDLRPDIPDDINTFVPASMSKVFFTVFEGNNGFLYRRLSFDEVLATKLPAVIIPPATSFKTSEILPQLNDLLGLQLVASDIVEEDLTNDIVSFPVRAHRDSLVWIGSLPCEIDTNIPLNIRLMEDGTPRLNEDGSYRLVET